MEKGFNKTGMLNWALTVIMQSIKDNDEDYLRTVDGSNFVSFFESETGITLKTLKGWIEESSNLSVQELLKDAPDYTIKQLAEKYHISGKMIIYYCNKNNVQYKKDRTGVNKDYIKILNSFNGDFTIEEMATKSSINQKLVANLCYRYQIPFKRVRQCR